MENTLTKTIAAITVPIILVDFLSGIVGFIWLAVLGQWGPIIGGVIYIFISTFFLSIFLLPSLALGALMIPFIKKNFWPGAAFFGILSVAYVAGLIVLTSYWMFKSYVGGVPEGTSLWPFLLWTYSIVMAPWAYMASKEGSDATGTYIVLFFSKLGLILVLLLVGLFGVSIPSAFVVFGFVMLIEVLVAAGLALYVLRETAKNGRLDGQNDNQTVYDYGSFEQSPYEQDDIVNVDNFSLGNTSSILLVGQTGTGKTYFVRTLIRELMNNYSADEVNLVLFDLKQVEFVNDGSDFDYKYLLKDVVKTPTKGLKVLEELIDLAELRIKKNQIYPAIVTYIEECDMAVTNQAKFDKDVIKLINLGAKANLCIIYSTSRIGATTISKRLLNRFELILASQMASSAEKYLGIGDTSGLGRYNFIRYDNLPDEAVKVKENSRTSTPQEQKAGIPFKASKVAENTAGDDELVDWDTIK